MGDTVTFSELIPIWLFSGALLCAFLLVRLEVLKSWFVLSPLPGRLSARMIYAAFPLGLAFLVLGIGGMCPIGSIIHSAGLPAFFLLSLVGILFMIWPPSWIKPRWLRWLEREYGYGVDILIEEARAMGRWRWETRVWTREGLENWVQGVLEKRKKDMDQAWMKWFETQAMERAIRGHGAGRGPLEYFKIPYVPKHREKDYQQYLKAKREEISSLRESAREQWQELYQALSTAVESFFPEEPFTVADLMHACPGVDQAAVRHVLNRLRAQGKVECTGHGRSARWRRV